MGFYNPKAVTPGEKLRIDVQRVQYWLSKGAKPSERVADLLKLAAASE